LENKDIKDACNNLESCTVYDWGICTHLDENDVLINGDEDYRFVAGLTNLNDSILSYQLLIVSQCLVPMLEPPG
jgi:hypothetical protein